MEKLINMIKSMYSDAYSVVLYYHLYSRNIVRQGCILSPLLFIRVLDEILKKVAELSGGITWRLHSSLDILH